jgi:nucleosome-remodeling factor subunit BPTF
LRKRKRAESPDKTDPVIIEEWVDEDKIEIWEIKLYHEKLDRKGDYPKSLTPSTRTKSGVTLSKPEKYDPSTPDKGDKTISATKAAEMVREQMETEMKMQRAVHLSKRDNHPKNNNIIIRTPIPTASQQLQQQQAAAGKILFYFAFSYQ